MPPPLAADDPGGLAGFALWLVDTLGEWGVGAFTVLETVFPPIPSEVVLPLAGYQATRGELSLPLLLVASTTGSLAGALALHGLGRLAGRERAIRWLAKLPLVEREDFEKASSWFDRHGRAAVLVGRLVPGVRSVISLPAGSERMPLPMFVLFTVLGSALWNGLLLGLGALLGRQHDLVERYSSVLNWVVAGALALGVALLVVRGLRRRSRGRGTDGEGVKPSPSSEEARRPEA